MSYEQLLRPGNEGVANSLDMVGVLRVFSVTVSSPPSGLLPPAQRSTSTSLESGNRFLPGLARPATLPLSPLPRPNQAPWKPFLSCYFPEKQFSDNDDNNNDNVVNTY